METLAELERIQSRILHRISNLERSHLPQHFSQSLSLSPATAASATAAADATTELRLSSILCANGVRDFAFKRVPSDYYCRPLEARRDVLSAASIHHLCKSIVLVNTQAPSDVTDCGDRNYSKYYVVIVQYTARFNAESVKNFLYTLNDGKISKKKINNALVTVHESCIFEEVFQPKIMILSRLSTFGTHPISAKQFRPLRLIFIDWTAFHPSTLAMRLAPEAASAKLTGYEHNGVTCIGMKTDIPVILDEAIVKLKPDFFWLGGGEIDLKLGIRTSQFIDFVKPFVVNCSSS